MNYSALDKVLAYLNDGVIDESVQYKNIYHLSKSNLNNKILQPKVPDNFLTKNGYEDNTIKRVCFSTTIEGCLCGLSQNIDNQEFYVHVPVEKVNYIKPTVKQVPDVKITKEIWVTDKVKIKCIGKIVAHDNGKPGIKYKYGNKTVELYTWDYDWIDRIDESKDASDLDSNFKKKSDLHFKILDMKLSSANKYVPKEYKDEFNYKTKDAAIAVCKEDDELAGFIYWNPKSGTIGPLKVYINYRGYGISELLLKTAIDGGGHKLGVYEDNKVAYNLYKKMGFKEVDRKEYADGDVAIMMELDKK